MKTQLSRMLPQLVLLVISRYLFAAFMAFPAILWGMLFIMALAFYSEQTLLACFRWLADHSFGLMDSFKDGGNITLSPQSARDIPLTRILTYLMFVLGLFFYFIDVLGRWWFRDAWKITLAFKLIMVFAVAGLLALFLISTYWFHKPDGINASMTAAEFPLMVTVCVTFCGMAGGLTAGYVALMHVIGLAFDHISQHLHSGR
ncbi:hypothetical protein [Bacterioplanes sanyensis]|nr:hypothetical protein [Bacterioplanes sanyensis]